MLGRKIKSEAISSISLFDVYLNTLPYSFCVCVCVCVCVWIVDCVFVIASICVCVHVCMHMREREREQKWFLFCFLGKTCKIAILTEVLLLGMAVVELMRKCVVLCRLQHLLSLVHFEWDKRDNKLQRQVDERYECCSHNQLSRGRIMCPVTGDGIKNTLTTVFLLLFFFLSIYGLVYS